MKPSRVLGNLSQGLPSLGVCLHLTDPGVFEMTSLIGVDAIWMDLEHHYYSLETAAHLMRAARIGGTDIVARPAKGEFARLSRMLEAGASGIMYPRCSDAAEAAEVVRWGKFAPVGQRGFDGSGPDVPYMLTPMGDYLQQANAQTFLIIQIEDPQALEQAEAIAAVPGVDMLMLGPADFSILTGTPGDFSHPRIQAAFETIAAAARNTGKHWAATCGSLERAEELIQMGAKLVFHGCDIVFVKNGIDAVQREFLKRFRSSPANGSSNAPKSYLERS
ncbi:HpcH/HpaI aldolase family protein [Planctomicrobium sp. SH664]|uniref:HpcH/HpaI aldolase family protein n=1 Tax=Planctomicrobium sp. SH664 TaxID=3448125 RepID=UPI003F5C2DB5